MTHNTDTIDNQRLSIETSFTLFIESISNEFMSGGYIMARDGWDGRQGKEGEGNGNGKWR